VALEAGDAFDLVKVNVDENPVIAGKLGARSIPLVVGFKDGEPVSSFVGVQPESAIRRFVAGLLPTEADNLVSDAASARERGEPGEAETLLKTALETDPRHQKARLALAQLLGDQGRRDEALQVLGRADPEPAVEQLRASLRLASSGELDLDELRAKAAAGDRDAAIRLGGALAAEGDAAAALEVLLAAVQQGPRADAGAARQAMLDVFNVLGTDDPLVREYRAKLAQALF
jgi:putative thioredoxin